jgi:hypothetical protein
MQRSHDFTGQKISFFTALRPALIYFQKGKASGWVCKCECGKEFFATSERIKSGRVKSCGCKKSALLSSHVKHGHYASGRSSPELMSWRSAVARCHDPKCSTFHRYGALGVTVCEEWRNDFPAFLAELGTKPPGTTLDRIDGTRGYEPGNCRWSTPKQQSNNMKNNRFVSVAGERLTIRDASDRFGLPYSPFRCALNKKGSFTSSDGTVFTLIPL